METKQNKNGAKVWAERIAKSINALQTKGLLTEDQKNELIGGLNK